MKFTEHWCFCRKPRLHIGALHGVCAHGRERRTKLEMRWTSTNINFLGCWTALFTFKNLWNDETRLFDCTISRTSPHLRAFEKHTTDRLFHRQNRWTKVAFDCFDCSLIVFELHRSKFRETYCLTLGKQFCYLVEKRILSLPLLSSKK